MLNYLVNGADMSGFEKIASVVSGGIFLGIQLFLMKKYWNRHYVPKIILLTILFPTPYLIVLTVLGTAKILGIDMVIA